MKLYKVLIVYFFTLLCTYNAIAQGKVALQHNGSSSFFTDIPTAVAAAVSGDTIYLPGGSFSGFNIDKKLAIIGVGHNPDSTVVTNQTIILGDIVLYSGSSGGEIWGLNLQNGKIDIASQNTVDGFRVSRCFVKAVFCIGGDAIANNFVIAENIISASPLCPGCGQIASVNLTGNNISVLNNVILGPANFTNTFLSNNIFTGIYNNYSTFVIHNCLVENNIFNPTPYYFSKNNSIFHNNLFQGINGSDYQGNQGSGNIFPPNSFADQFANYSPSNYIYINDFHLTNIDYNTGDTYGTSIGIYGGAFPWKAGSVPFNPHINLKVISPTTDSSGNLPIQIRAKAQNN